MSEDPDDRDGYAVEEMEALREALDELPEPRDWEDAAEALLDHEGDHPMS